MQVKFEDTDAPTYICARDKFPFFVGRVAHQITAGQLFIVPVYIGTHRL